MTLSLALIAYHQKMGALIEARAAGKLSEEEELRWSVELEDMWRKLTVEEQDQLHAAMARENGA